MLSIVRIQFLHIQNDLTWGNVDSGTWSMIELSSGIVCANLATLRPLFKTVFPWLSVSGSAPGRSDGLPPSDAVVGSGASHSQGHISLGPFKSTRSWSSRSGDASAASRSDPDARDRLSGKASHDSMGSSSNMVRGTAEKAQGGITTRGLVGR